ncbi:MAG TPA: protein kinase [Vicinamibacterales bacterium]|nr:protein kinase [Vicinamibacterales bacterium]
MSLAAGDKVGPFEIVALLGEGGMGQVYRARDPKLGRDVAIKVLPDALARDTERLTRFRREAQALAALNDPHVAQIYHLEEAGDRAALVMELVEGRTIAELVHGGPLDVDDAVRYASEIAAGLESAHEKGIVHRDLKPANVKITPDGRAKILDFGLAKAMASDSGSTELMNSPTLTARATEAGVILGTAAYMSPEQARGKSVDKRTDIWAFGALLFEMLTGRRAFEGQTVSDTLASVLRSDPDWAALPVNVPPHVRAVLGRCLERDASRRLRDIGEARLALTGATSPVATAIQTFPATISGPIPSGTRTRPWAWIGATAVLAVIVAALLPTSSLVRSGAASLATEAFELAIAPPAGAEFQIGSNLGNVALSPDGTRIAFVAATDKALTLWVQSLDRDDARSIPGTEGAANPFWSPDGRRLGFFADGKLRTVSIAGGLPENIAEASSPRGGTWSDDDTIVFCGAGGGALSRVAAAGGVVTPVTTLDAGRGENAHYWPVMLPGGKQFLYFVRSVQAENGGIYLGHLDGSPAMRLVASLSSGFVAKHPATGAWYLMWARDDELLAQPFDLASGTLSGEATPIVSGVRVEDSQRLVYASASLNGRLAWALARAAETTLSLVGRDGRPIRRLEIPPGSLWQPAISPDGRRLLFIRVERGGSDIFMYDFGTRVTERLTSDPDYDELPLWTPDGKAMSYLARDRGQRVSMRLAIGTGSTPVRQAGPVIAPGLESPDGRYLIYTVLSEGTTSDVMVASLGAAGESAALVKNPAEELAVAQSTDGRTVLIQQRAAARGLVAVARVRPGTPLPTLGPLLPVAEGAPFAALRPDGREVIVIDRSGMVKAVAITPSGDTVAIGATTPLFMTPPGADAITVNPTGTEFVVTEQPFAAGQTLRVLTRWDARLK